MEKFQAAVVRFFERFVQLVGERMLSINGIIVLLEACKISSSNGCSIVGTASDCEGELCSEAQLQDLQVNLTSLLQSQKQEKAARKDFGKIKVSYDNSSCTCTMATKGPAFSLCGKLGHANEQRSAWTCQG